MKYLKKFESVKDFNDEDVVYLQNIIEDTLIDFDVDVQCGISNDNDMDMDNYDEYTSSVYFLIEPQLKEYNFMMGNPHSSNSIDIQEALRKQKLYTDSMCKFTNEIKSLCFRLEKMGYSASSYKFDGIRVILYFIVENGEIKKGE